MRQSSDNLHPDEGGTEIFLDYLDADTDLYRLLFQTFTAQGTLGPPLVYHIRLLERRFPLVLVRV